MRSKETAADPLMLTDCRYHSRAVQSARQAEVHQIDNIPSAAALPKTKG